MKKWNAQEDARLRQLKGNHAAYEDIGIRMGRSKEEVRYRWKKLKQCSKAGEESNDDTDSETEITTNIRFEGDRYNSVDSCF